MKIFISWSGDRSRLLAEAIHDWIPYVLPAAQPWMSTKIQRGKGWFEVVRKNLDEADMGIICVTSENLNEPWLLFEAGALSKSIIKESLIAPVLLDLDFKEMADNPLSLFQGVRVITEDMRALVLSINKEMADRSITVQQLNTFYDRSWQDLEAKIKNIPGPKVNPFEVLIYHDKIVRITFRSEKDMTWEEFIKQILNVFSTFPEETLRVASAEADAFHYLDLVKEEWLDPPRRLSMLQTEFVALVHKDRVKQFQNSPTILSTVIKTSLRAQQKN